MAVAAVNELLQRPTYSRNDWDMLMHSDIANKSSRCWRRSLPKWTHTTSATTTQEVVVAVADPLVTGHLTTLPSAQGVVVFARGSGSSRHSAHIAVIPDATHLFEEPRALEQVLGSV